MKTKNINGEISNYEQEYEMLNQKYGRLKYLIENSVKIYSEFWGIFATNITNNLNISKLYKLGQKLNMYQKANANVGEEPPPVSQDSRRSMLQATESRRGRRRRRG